MLAVELAALMLKAEPLWAEALTVASAVDVAPTVPRLSEFEPVATMLVTAADVSATVCVTPGTEPAELKVSVSSPFAVSVKVVFAAPFRFTARLSVVETVPRVIATVEVASVVRDARLAAMLL
jgi:hypothetical protein